MPQVESPTASERPPPQDAWVVELRSLLPQWESLRDSSKVIIPISISRVNQFDAARLDVEMSAMLKEQLVKVFSLMKPGLLFQYEPELDAFLEFLIWRFSIWVDKPTPGNALMNLRYRDERAAPITGKEGTEEPNRTEPKNRMPTLTLVDDYLSYWLHRFLHTKWGYKKIHCIHHEKTAPTGFAAAYAAGTELSLYLVTLFVGPAIVPSHVTTHWLWFAIRIMEAFDTHCGYHFPFSLTRVIPFYGGAEFHDYHHYAGGKTHSNFGSVFTYCDYIYGTNKGYMHHKGSLAKLKMEAEHNMKGNNGKEE